MSVTLSSRLLSVLLLSSVICTRAQAKIYTNPNQLKQTVYDFVIVGGNVLANRLSENSKFSVLVIEAGVTNENLLPSIVPFLAPSLTPNSSATWNYTTVPQSGLDDRTVPYPRGKVLGGSSTINFMTYTRGSDDDFNRYAALTGDPGWSWDALLPYYLKSSRLVPPADHHDTTGQANPAVHGHGPIEVSVGGFPTELDLRVINSSKESGGEFPFNVDLNSGKMIGFSYLQSTIGDSKRSSSATAYLEPALGRTNLDVLIQTQVTRLIKTGTVKGLPEFKQAELAQNSSSQRFTVRARNEIILAAGSIGTPQILLLSGIGNKTTLRGLGIETIVNLPDVGQHLQDHPLLPNYFLVNSTSTFDPVLRNATLAGQKLQEWNTTGEGLFVDAPGNTLGFFRLPNNASIFKTFPDPSSGPLSPHIEFIFADGFAVFGTPTPPTGNYMTLITIVVSPLSRGSVTLASTDPFTFPHIDPGFFTSAFDVFTMVAALKDAFRFIAAPPWRGFVLAPFGDLVGANSDAALAAHARKNIVTVWHPVGTARMVCADAPSGEGVVGPDLLVKGVSGVRIVDASIFPVIPAAHPVGAVYIVAERAADLVKAAWK